MKRNILLPALCALFLAGFAGMSAQVLMQPTEPPTESALQADWYLEGDPLVFNGAVFHRAGAQVFFNGDVMVRAGSYDRIPIYVDTTLEPNSIVYVPVGGRMMQPYERLRDGALAGTTGSRAPSFPVTPAPARTFEYGERLAMAGGPPAGPELVPPTREEEPVAFETGAEEGPPVGTGGSIPATRIVTFGPPAPALLRSARAPETTRGVWIEYEGARWQACGKAEPFDEATFQQAGAYRGYPVYAHKGVATSERIYMPSLPGFVAPYWRGSVTRDPAGNCESVAQVASPD